MHEQPTPETDEESYDDPSPGYPVVRADVARKLERERDEARTEMIRWQSIAEGRGRTDDEEEEERNIGWQNKWQVAVEMAALAQNELAAVTAQRDEVLSDLEFRRQLYVVLAERCDRHTVELAETRVQRDRLAEALKEIYNVSSFDYATMPEPARKKYREVVLEMADDALQSLTTKENL